MTPETQLLFLPETVRLYQQAATIGLHSVDIKVPINRGNLVQELINGWESKDHKIYKNFGTKTILYSHGNKVAEIIDLDKPMGNPDNERHKTITVFGKPDVQLKHVNTIIYTLEWYNSQQIQPGEFAA